MEKVRPAELLEICKVFLVEKEAPSLFILGSPGIGKSSIVTQACRSFQLPLKTSIATLMDPTDIKGLPLLDNERVKWVPPSFMPTEGEGEKGILFWDELTTAPPAVQAAVYRVILEGVVGDYALPEGWKCIAAGNKLSDRAVVYPMPTPLRNRFVWVELVPSVEDFRKYGWAHRFHPDVLGYVHFNRDHLFTFDPELDEEVFATPRSWEFVSRLLKIYEASGTPSEKVLNKLIAGAVGEGVAAGFYSFLKCDKYLPSPETVIDGREDVYPQAADQIFALGSSVVSYVVAHPTPERVERLTEYLIGFRQKEYTICFLNDALQAGITGVLQTTAWKRNADKLYALLLEKRGTEHAIRVSA